MQSLKNMRELFPDRADLSDVYILAGDSHEILAGTHLYIETKPEEARTIMLTLAETATDVCIGADIAEAARVSIVVLGRAGDVSVKINQRSRVSSNGSVHWHNVTLGQDVSQKLVSTIEGAHAESTIDWIFFGNASDRHALSVRNVFNGRDGTGEITMKGVAEKNAHLECFGMIDIGTGGGGTNTYLTEDVLMLDATAKIDAIPALEIHTNDVKASHSATIARVTEEDLFYFGARGIDEHFARIMYTEGFLQDLTERIADQVSREKVRSAIGQKLHV